MLRHLRPLRGWAGSQLRRPAKDRAGKTIASRFGDGRERRLPGWDAVCVRFRAKRTLVQTRRMTESVKGFGCRPHTAMPRTPAAGVRKPPREETAIGEGGAVPRGRYGDLSATAVGANGA